MFTSASGTGANGLHRQWLLGQKGGAQTLEHAFRVKFAERHQVVTRPGVTPRVKRHVFRKGRKALNPAMDNMAKRTMARQAIELSLEWAPQAGLFAQDPQPSARTTERAINRVIKYETRVVAAALNTWHRWINWCEESEPKVAVMGMDVNSWKDFIHGSSSAATVCHVVWLHCKWLAMQLKAPIPFQNISAPAEKADKTGGTIVEDNPTPTADPELLAYFEGMIHTMEKDGDRRLGVVL